MEHINLNTSLYRYNRLIQAARKESLRMRRKIRRLDLFNDIMNDVVLIGGLLTAVHILYRVML